MTAVPLDSFRADLERLRGDAEKALAAAADAAALEAARVEFLGARSGRLKAIQKALGGLGTADKPAGGKQFNDTKNAITASFEAAAARVGGAAGRAEAAGIDVTLPGTLVRRGHLHPLTQTIRRVQEIMGRLGFESVDGPEVEDQWHNFEALAIPPRSTPPAIPSITSTSPSPGVPIHCCCGRRRAPCRSG